MTSWDDLLPTNEAPDPDARTPQGLLEMLDAQAADLVSVATGGPKIEHVNARYVRRKKKLDRALRERGIARPFPFDDLWAWHGHYSQHLPTWAQRRKHIAGLAAPAREALEAVISGVQVHDPGSPREVSWADLDTRVDGVVTEFRDAKTRDDLQDVGRRCREVLIDAAKLLADPALVPEGHEAPKEADAKAWFEILLKTRAGGSSHRELRAFIPVAWNLAQKVTHGDIDRVDAYAAAQATVLIVRTLGQLVGAEDA